MLVRAKVSFAGAFSMYKGEVKECSDEAVLQDLLHAGYVEKVVPGRSVKNSEGKRDDDKQCS